MPRFVEPSWLYFVREGALLRQKFSASAKQVEGIAFTVVDAVRFNQSIGYAHADVSVSGDIVYETPTPPNDFVPPARSGGALRVDESLTRSADRAAGVRIEAILQRAKN